MSPQKKYPLVSVIVPVYNMQRFLSETLQSVLKSDYPNIEVIVMDDGSTDESKKIADGFSGLDSRVKAFSQQNQRASSARNNAILLAKGNYILPVDADNLISADYIRRAVTVLEEKPDVKVVSCEAEFFGEKSGRWRFEPFSLNLLCRRNLIDNCAMYRKTDWEHVGGYCELLRGREDWDFWLSVFEQGGLFFRLPIVGLYYRARSDSKRVSTRHLHKQLIDYLNIRHKPLFFRELGGRLHYQRTHSRKINRLISLFRPHFVGVNHSNPKHEKLVFFSNEENKRDKIHLINYSPEVLNETDFIEFTEHNLHLPFFKIRKSNARKRFDSNNLQHIGFYEEQISFTTLKSYLIITRSTE